MSKAIITESYLTDIADAIRGKTGGSDTYTPAQMAGAITAIPTGSTAELIYSGTVTSSTTSTSSVLLATLALGTQAYTKYKIVYVQIRDNAGPRNGYFYGSDSYFYNYYKANNATTALTYAMREIWSRTTAGAWDAYNPATTTGYGIYPYSITSSGNLKIHHRYNSTYSKTIDGTFTVKVYLLDYPADSPFAT